MNETLYSIEARREDHGNLRVVLEAPGSATLAEVHTGLARAFELGNRRYSYFMSGELWDERTEFRGGDARGPQRAASARLDRLALRAGSPFACATDEEVPRVFRLRVLAVRPAPAGNTSIREVERSGSNEPTAEQLAFFETEREWVAAREGVFARAAEIDGGENEREPAALREQLVSARELLAWLDRRPECLLEIEGELGVDPLVTLAGLPERLWGAGLHDEAFAFCDEGMRTRWSEAFEAERIFLLTSADRLEEAREFATRELERRGPRPSLAMRAAMLFERLEDHPRALELYRGLFERTRESDAALYFGSQVAAMHEKLGREDLARSARVEMLSRANELSALEEATTDDDEHEAPEPVGRNEPCPCGSGKKFKKCCGARTEDPEFEAKCGSDWIGQMMRFAQGEPELAEPGEALATFGGEEFRDLSLDEARALFTGDDSETLFLLWLVLDYVGPIGESIADRFTAHYRTRGTPREREVLAKLRGTHLGLYEVASDLGGGFASLRDVLDEANGTCSVQTGIEELDRGLWIAARIVQLDGHYQMLPGALDFRSEEHDELLRRLRDERAKSGLDWNSFLRSHGHLFHRLARELANATGS